MQDYYQHIEEYINGLLKGEELIAFEQAMASDASLKAAVDNYGVGEKLSEGLLEMDVMDVIGKLEEGGEPNADSESTSRPWYKMKRLWFLLMWIGLMIIALYWIVRNGTKQERENREWYATVYKRPIDPDATKSIDTVGMTLFEKGKFFFSLNDFEKSEKILREALKTAPNEEARQKARFWLGHALVNQGKWEGREMLEE